MELLIFNHMMSDPAIRAMESNDRYSVMRELISFAELNGVSHNPLREYIVSALLSRDTLLSYAAAQGRVIGHDLYEAALDDIEKIWDEARGYNIPYVCSGNDTGFFDGYIKSVKKLTSAESPKALLDGIIEHYRALGCSIFAKYTAFKYDGEIEGISRIEDVTFDSLVGLEYQKQVLKDNTEAFINGRMANNVLLFGDRGTGKSSSVKALLNMYSSKGLRVIEMPKSFIGDIPKLTKTLCEKPHKYIIFLDDLSFERDDPQYRALKVAMEGQLQAKMDNVLIYATSNRKHLIKESLADRQNSDFNLNDHMQDTLSLSERFGISLIFSSPDKKEYLNIVKELLKTHGVEADAETEKQAIVWQMRYGTKSARCAKQFVSAYVSKLQAD